MYDLFKNPFLFEKLLCLFSLIIEEFRNSIKWLCMHIIHFKLKSRYYMNKWGQVYLGADEKYSKTEHLTTPCPVNCV